MSSTLPSSISFLFVFLFIFFFPFFCRFFLFFFFTFLTFQNNRYILYADTVPPYFWFSDILPPFDHETHPHSNTTSIFALSFLNSFSFQFSYFCDRYLINFFNFFQLHLIFHIFFPFSTIYIMHSNNRHFKQICVMPTRARAFTNICL